MNFEKEIMQYLKSQYYHYQEEWVKDCVQFYVSNKPNITITELKCEVKQQWLLTNLRDMNVAVFPPDLQSHQKFTLPGKYAVQVESMVDSSMSFYQCLTQIRNLDCENIKATEKFKDMDENPRRCLTLKITDGVQELEAMEYQPIPGLKLNDPEQPPGFKIVILGPVICRKGMLLLKRENVCVLGGEVDVLLESNNLESLLIKNLNSLKGANEEISNDRPLQRRLEKQAPKRKNLENCVNEQASHNAENDSFNALDFIHDPFENSDLFMNVPEVTLRNVACVPTSQETTSMRPLRSDQEATSYLSCQVSKAVTRIVPSSPYVYLAQIISHKINSDTTFKIKAVILTLKSKIITIGDSFSLTAKICDGTASVDVTFSSEVLEEMLGFSSFEMAAMKKEAAINNAVAERLKNSFVSTQAKLISLNAILHVEFFKQKSIPIVRKIEEITSDHLKLLASRQLM